MRKSGRQVTRTARSIALGSILAIAWIAPAALHADSALDREFGTPRAGLSGRERAMGGAGAALDGNPTALLGIPATMALGRGTRLQFTGDVGRASETRYVPLYDTFDSYVADAAIAVNDHVTGEFGGGVAMTRREWRGVTLGIASYERFDPRHDYQDERRTTATTDEVVAERFITTRGTLRGTSFGAAYPLPWWDTAVGVAVTHYGGTITDRDALVSRVANVSGLTLAETRDLSGTSLTLGAHGRIGNRLDAALAWESGPKLHDDFTTWSDDSITSAPNAHRNAFYPPRVTLAGAYRPRNTLRTTFVTDVIWTGWSNIRDPRDPSLRFNDTWDVRFGLEHVYANTLPARIGFRYERAPQTSEADRVAFTFGVGYKLDRVALDLSSEVSRRQSWQDPVWARVDQGPAIGAGSDRVQDGLMRLSVDATWEF
ncbi:MAG TPA: hypothetical protein VL332_04890 [Candidatus Saccharimonadaceae bacterium]|nr:hypothetical protein [Candidatus Saccharimonadaceae bacterium]